MDFLLIDKETTQCLLCFIGKDKAYVTEILNVCGLYADIGVFVLIEQPLVKVEKNNKFQMHDLLRDMAGEIVCLPCQSFLLLYVKIVIGFQKPWLIFQCIWQRRPPIRNTGTTFTMAC